MTAEEGALADALDRLRLDRLRHADVLAADPREHPDVWELNGALVALVDGVLLDLDADADTRHREGPQSERRAAQLRKLLSSRRLKGERTPSQQAMRIRGRARARRTPLVWLGHDVLWGDTDTRISDHALCWEPLH